jgi:outer membrane protein assembly factor BamB
MRRRAVFAIALGCAGGALLAAAAAAPFALAQSFETRRPRTFVVGARRAGSATDRVDGARTGLSPSTLPSARVVVAWRRTVGPSLEGPVVVDDAGTVYAIAGRGEVVTLSPDGSERARVPTGLPQPGPPTLLSDGTVVFTSALGEAAGVLRGAVRFRARIGAPTSATIPVAPLPLEDGGAVAAVGSELALLDAEGNVRARAHVAEPITAPIVSAHALGQPAVVVVTAPGTVYAWSFGPDAARVGSFGGPIDGGAALADAHTLVAVTANGSHLDALDLDRGVAVTRAVSPDGLYLGPPAMRGENAFLLAYTDTDSCAVALDPSGRETSRIILAPTGASLLADAGASVTFVLPTGSATATASAFPTSPFTPPSASASAGPGAGPAPLVVPPHGGPIVDSAGTLAFVTPDGDIGIAPAAGGVDTLGEGVCPPPSSALTAADTATRLAIMARGGMAPPRLSPAGEGAFVVACPTGVVAKITASRRH